MTNGWPDNFTLCKHPLITHKLSYLRQPSELIHFRTHESLIEELGLILGYEAVRGCLELADITDRQNDGTTAQAGLWRAGKRVVDRPIIVSTVRSGLIMANAMRTIIPTAFMGHIALANDPERNPYVYMITLPEGIKPTQRVILVDLFIERGRTAKRAIEELLENNIEPSNILFVSLIITPEGRDELMTLEQCADIQFFTAHLDAPETPEGNPARWLGDFTQTNFRLFRTHNTRSKNNDP